MSTCRCGAWVGHPEARSCTVPDCELRAAVLDVASEPGSWARAMSRGCLTDRTSDYQPDQPARHREPERLRGGVESVPVHEVSNAA